MPRRIPRKPKPNNSILPQARMQKTTYKDVISAYQDKVASINFRNDALQRIQNSNYANEYHRIQGEMSSTILPDANLQRLQQRQQTLKELFKSVGANE